MKNQTAVEYLDNRIKDESVLMQNSEGYYICIRVKKLEEIMKQTKEMEKNQIMNCYYEGLWDKRKHNLIPIHETREEEVERFGEQYYNETYGK